jgi:hypothetical protein
MKRIKPLNLKARRMDDASAHDVRGYAFNDCCASFAPGWEVGWSDDADPCPWKSDLSLCWSTCYWMGQVPDTQAHSDWLDACGNIQQDWRSLCTIPDTK